MKRFQERPSSVFALTICGLIGVNGWIGWTSWIRWDQSRSAMAQEQHLEHVAHKIEALREQPVQIEEGLRTNDALARLIESAAQQVSLNPEQIVRIDPGEARRLEKTPYLEQRTNVEVRETPLRKLLEFCLALEQKSTGLQVSSLSTRVPATVESSDNKDELWNAQLLLTSRIYEANVRELPPSSTP